MEINSSSAYTDKHRLAGQHVATQYDTALKQVHLRIKSRGTYTTWAVRHAHRRHGA
jgi:hypothetical protein